LSLRDLCAGSRSSTGSAAGGAWRRGNAADFAFQAEMFVRAGTHHVVLDFMTVDDAKGDLAPGEKRAKASSLAIFQHHAVVPLRSTTMAAIARAPTNSRSASCSTGPKS
jgi:hypothetical protein